MRKKRALKLIKNHEGVTVVFALVIFMIAALISAAIVGAAMNNLSRIRSEQANRQARISVISAADFLQSENDELSTRLEELVAGESTDSPSEDDWVISGSSKELTDALGVTIEWEKIVQYSYLEAVIRSGDASDGYAVKVTLAYNPSEDDDMWMIRKMVKVD